MTVVSEPLASRKWVTGMTVRQSLLSGDVWVPYEALDTRDFVTQNAGPLESVKAWCEGHVRGEYVEGGFALPLMAWVLADETTHVLLVSDH